MQTMIVNASRYDWSTWSMGLMRSFLQGGGGALVGFVGPMATDSRDFNLGSGLGHTAISMLIGFGIAGALQMGMFLKTHGAPDPIVAQALAEAAQASSKATEAIHVAQDAAASNVPEAK